jgi:hypothetical protein
MSSSGLVFVVVFGALVAASLTLRHRASHRPASGTDLVLPSGELQAAMRALDASLGERAPQALAAISEGLVALHRQAAVAVLHSAPPHLYEDMLRGTERVMDAFADLDVAARDAHDQDVTRAAQDVVERRTAMLLRAVRNRYNIRVTGFPAPSSSGAAFFSAYRTDGA